MEDQPVLSRPQAGSPLTTLEAIQITTIVQTMFVLFLFVLSNTSNASIEKEVTV